MLKTPFSKKSMETGEYSEKEKSLLEAGTLSELDATISRILYSSNQNANAEFVKSIDDGSLLTLLIKGSEDEFIGKDGTSVNALSKELKRKIRIVTLSDRIELTVAALYGVKIVKVVESYAPAGEAPKKVFVKKHELSEDKVAELNKLLSYLYGMKTEIVAPESQN